MTAHDHYDARKVMYCLMTDCTLWYTEAKVSI